MLRRYSEFDDLYQALCKTLPASALPVLPPKLLLNTADALADRIDDDRSETVAQPAPRYRKNFSGV